MLTLSKPISAGQAQAYHRSEFANAKENYYTEGERGRGAARHRTKTERTSFTPVYAPKRGPGYPGDALQEAVDGLEKGVLLMRGKPLDLFHAMQRNIVQARRRALSMELRSSATRGRNGPVSRASSRDNRSSIFK